MSQQLGLPRLKADGRRRYALRSRCRLMELPVVSAAIQNFVKSTHLPAHLPVAIAAYVSTGAGAHAYLASQGDPPLPRFMLTPSQEIRIRIWRFALRGSTATLNTSVPISKDWSFSSHADLLRCSEAILHEARPLLHTETVLTILSRSFFELKLHDWMWAKTQEIHISSRVLGRLKNAYAAGRTQSLHTIVVQNWYAHRLVCQQRDLPDGRLLRYISSSHYGNAQIPIKIAAGFPKCQVLFRFNVDIRGVRWRHIECEIDSSFKNLRRVVDKPVRKMQPKWKRVYN